MNTKKNSKQNKKNITSKVKETQSSNILKFTPPVGNKDRSSINGSIILKEEYCKNYSTCKVKS